MEDKRVSPSQASQNVTIYVLSGILFYVAISYGYPVYATFLVSSVSAIKYIANGAGTYPFWACTAVAISCYVLDLTLVKRLHLKAHFMTALLFADLVLLFGVNLLSVIDDNSFYHKLGFANANSLYHFSTAFVFILLKNGVFEFFKRKSINKNNDAVGA